MYPIHLNLGFRVFHYYEGFYFIVAIAAAYLLAAWRLQRAGLRVQVLEESVPWILLVAILGARMFHFIFWDWASFRADPMGFFRFWDGGLSITGGLAGGAAAALFCFRRWKLDIWAYALALSPAVLVGQAVGRVGCFLNGDAWGIPTGLPWGVSQPRFGVLVPGFTLDPRVPSAAWEWCVAQGFSAPSAPTTVPLHPTQLYEALGDLILAAMVLLLGRAMVERHLRPDKVIWLHLGGYALLRFGLEFLHGDRDALVWAGMTALQLGLLAFAVLSGAAGLLRRNRVSRPGV